MRAEGNRWGSWCVGKKGDRGKRGRKRGVGGFMGGKGRMGIVTREYHGAELLTKCRVVRAKGFEGM